MGRRLVPPPLVGAAVALAACTTEFPAWHGGPDGGPPACVDCGAPAETPDAALERDDGGRPDATPPCGPHADGGCPPRPWEAPDAEPHDAAPPPLPDAAPPAPSLLLETDDTGEGGCAPRDVRLTWHTAGVSSCRLASHPPGTDLAAAAEGEAVVQVAADAQFVLTCRGPDGPLSTSLSIAFTPGLAPERALADRDEVRAEQRRCAAVRGHAALDDDAQVHDDDESARQICRCAGYGAVTARSDGGNRCFASPGDNELGYWIEAEDRWDARRAADHNRCLQQLTCAAPVARCADLYAP